MRRYLALLPLLLAGCSTAPVADLLDWLAPGRPRFTAQENPYGGVCIPQGGPVGGTAVPVVAAPGPVVAPPPPPAVVPVVPVPPAPAGTPPPPVFPGR